MYLKCLCFIVFSMELSLEGMRRSSMFLALLKERNLWLLLEELIQNYLTYKEEVLSYLNKKMDNSIKQLELMDLTFKHLKKKQFICHQQLIIINDTLNTEKLKRRLMQIQIYINQVKFILNRINKRNETSERNIIRRMITVRRDLKGLLMIVLI